MIKNILSLLFMFCFVTSINAQTEAERSRIISSYDISSINDLKIELEEQALKNAKGVSAFLSANPINTKISDNSEDYTWLERIDRFGQPVYITTTNFSGGVTIGANQLYDGGSLGLSIDGTNITAGIWDGGYVLINHREFGRRIEIGESGKSSSTHGTHVGGTMVAEGEGSINLRGMAPNGSLITFQFDDDANEMVNESSNGLLISNHSYGREVTESTDIAIFGKYDISAQNFDAITSSAPFYLPVVSAGNDRNDGFNSRKGGYDILTDRTLAKNVLTVGAVFEVEDYEDPSDVEMSNFSSWGPTDDGRIKPDLVAKGVGVLSTSDSSINGTTVLQGTSMSAPMVSGSLMLLQQLYNEREGDFMKASTLRGLVLMSTKEAGRSKGPDYQFGWGLMDVANAAQIILDRNVSSFILENNLSNNDVYTETFTTSSSNNLKIALAWTDLPGEIPSDDTDDRTPILVNDLDVKVINDDGTEFFPYTLDPESVRSSAKTGVNNVDNIEIVEIEEPSGTYTVEVTHKGNLFGGQEFSLLVNGATPQTASNNTEEIAGLSIFPNPANNYFNVTFDAATVSNEVSVKVFNTLGQVVIDRAFNNPGKFNERINISSLNSGIYFVKVGDSSVSSTRKLIIR